MKKTLLAVALTAASMTAIADVKISGHANYKAGLLEDFQDGGANNTPSEGNAGITVGNANTSKSRFRIQSTIDAAGITWGQNFEFGVNTGAGVDTRVNEVTAAGSFGKVSLGQGSIAGDGYSEADFSGTYLTFGDLASWELGGALADNGSKDINRAERILYTAPAIGNIHLAASINNGPDYTPGNTAVGAGTNPITGAPTSAVAAKAARADDANGNSYALAGAYKLDNFAFHVATIVADADDSDIVVASVAGKMANFTGAVQYFTQEGALSNDLEQTRVIVGYNPGKYSISVDFQQTETDTKSIEAETVGLNFVYRPTKGVELYAGARQAEADTSKPNSPDETAFLLGARVKF